MTLKHGAMFGLDARIALVIFAALSIISGAALQVVMSKITANKYLGYLTEVGKAYESYMLDTGIKTVSSRDLIENYSNVSNWNGPYLDKYRVVDSTGNKISFIQTGPWYQYYVGFSVLQNSVWSPIGNTWPDECAIDNPDCFVWYVLVGAHVDEAIHDSIYDIFLKVDALVDNSDGRLLGKVRYRDNGYAKMYLRGVPYIKTS